MTLAKPPLLCVPLTQPTPEEMVSVLQNPEQKFDIAEVRIDYLHEPRLEPLFACQKHPLLFTNRAERDRGGWKGTEEERLQVLNHAIRLGAGWIDIERECLPYLQRSEACKTVVSYHNFEETPSNLLDIAQEIEQMDGDVVKVATLAKSHHDNARMFEVLRRIKKPVIGVTMGPHGHVVRILGPKLGAFLVFASLQTGKESAPGQIPAEDLLNHYHFREMTCETEVYGLVDMPSGGHWSQVLNRVFSGTGVHAVAIPLETEDLADVLGSYKNLPFNGLSLGPGHWSRARELANDLIPGTTVVDTLTWKDGHWIGHTSGSGTSQSGTKDMSPVRMLAAQLERWTDSTLSGDLLDSLSSHLED
jgi:3-dehydroquinate dehydratase / shikimate dehydrogenase